MEFRAEVSGLEDTWSPISQLLIKLSDERDRGEGATEDCGTEHCQHGKQ